MDGYPAPERSQPRTARRARELATQALILAGVLWLVVFACLSSPSRRERFTGHLKGNDFLQFYVLGSAVRQGDFPALVSASGLRAHQLREVPDSADSFCQPVYGPQVALAFTPLAWLPYLWAYAAWAVVTFTLVLFCTRSLWRRAPGLAPFPRVIVCAALAYPPLAYLVYVGQISALALLVITALTVALGRGRFWLQAVSLGLLAYKPSLFGPAALVLLLAGEARLVGAACLVALAEVASVVPLVGLQVVRQYVLNTAGFAANPDVLAVNPHLMQSLRALWVQVADPGWARAGYFVTALGAAALGAFEWRRRSTPLSRVGALTVSICLVSPHLYTYDLLILAPALLAAPARLLTLPRTRLAAAHRALTYLAFLGAFPGAGLAAAGGFPPYPVVLAAWLTTSTLLPPEPTHGLADDAAFVPIAITAPGNSASR